MIIIIIKHCELDTYPWTCHVYCIGGRIITNEKNNVFSIGLSRSFSDILHLYCLPICISLHGTQFLCDNVNHMKLLFSPLIKVLLSSIHFCCYLKTLSVSHSSRITKLG